MPDLHCLSLKQTLLLTVQDKLSQALKVLIASNIRWIKNYEVKYNLKKFSYDSINHPFEVTEISGIKTEYEIITMII